MVVEGTVVLGLWRWLQCGGIAVVVVMVVVVDGGSVVAMLCRYGNNVLS